MEILKICLITIIFISSISKAYLINDELDANNQTTTCIFFHPDQLLDYEHKTDCLVIIVQCQSKDLTSIDGLSILSEFTSAQTLSLNLKYNSISDISSLESITYLTNLESVDISLSKNNIASIESLKNLGNLQKLTKLVLYCNNNEIRSLEPFDSLNKLTQLTYIVIQFSNNEIDSVQPILDNLKFLTNLTFLNLAFMKNNIHNVIMNEDLSALPLSTLNLNFYFNYIEDISQINSWSTISDLTSLNLNFALNKISSIDHFFDDILRCSKLERLSFSIQYNSISDIMTLETIGLSSSIRNLGIYINLNHIKSIEPLKNWNFSKLYSFYIAVGDNLDECTKLQDTFDSIADLEKFKNSYPYCFKPCFKVGQCPNSYYCDKEMGQCKIANMKYCKFASSFLTCDTCIDGFVLTPAKYCVSGCCDNDLKQINI